MHRHIPLLPENIQARKLQRRQNLRPIVVKRRRRVGDLEPHLLKPRRIMPDEIRLHRPKSSLGRFPAAAHLAEPGDAFIGLHFDDGADESPPMTPIAMPQRGFERNGDGGRFDVGDFHSCWLQLSREGGPRDKRRRTDGTTKQ